MLWNPRLHSIFGRMQEAIPYLDLPAQLGPIRRELDAAIARTLDQCSFCLGPDVAAFEQNFAAWCGASHCVAVNSGTSALHLALILLGVGSGDEVITTPFTFVATSWAISYVGARPVYIDIDPGSMCIAPSKIERAITKRTKAILPVHLYGQCADMTAIRKIADKHKLYVIEDNAQAIGARGDGFKIGELSDASTTSFIIQKNLGTFVEKVNCGALAVFDSSMNVHHREGRLANTGRTDEYRTCAVLKRPE